ncbi:MAG: hypothetical protein HN879_05820 [Flavobacteriaceae bacterium]|jgi:hypothetical protein|nr:hypothetical protein [Flavobacteriaceae bacterium]
MLYFVFFVSIFLTSCSVNTKQVNPSHANNITKSQQQTNKTSNKYISEKIIRTDFRLVLNKMFRNNIPKKYGKFYQNKMRYFLENAPDGQKKRSTSQDRFLTIEFKATETFKVKNQNQFCREYSHIVEYGQFMVENKGVACKIRSGDWHPLKIIRN